ncbi:excisionase family DNA-binding protein [Actinokineospora globicatena]|uniref:excisionase family DNA-binding protein n=1 Tax=Actinokineospora globicatena TaxID=103729 RepID=UPI0024A5A2A9|nr:DNA binding domain-containing protein, excisionase family [Actinokineospora globicatena]GLW80459.1 hypothetical protein Aglo01_49400 [Actinokineospora globicatena]GLW87287.1 hypothetical protein Aglo02_49260 [Actinokineospora globicatena]
MSETSNARLITVQQAADLMMVSRWTVYRLIWDGHVRSVQIGRSRRVIRESFDDYLSNLISEAA